MKLIIPGRPIAYVRTTQKAKYVQKSYIRYREFKQYVQTYALKAKIKPITEEKVLVYINVFLTGVSTPMGMDGDLDNYVKGILDSLNKIAYKDDRQVIQILASKQSDPDERTEVYIFADTIENRISYNNVIIKSLTKENENLFILREQQRQKAEGQIELEI